MCSACVPAHRGPVCLVNCKNPDLLSNLDSLSQHRQHCNLQRVWITLVYPAHCTPSCMHACKDKAGKGKQRVYARASGVAFVCKGKSGVCDPQGQHNTSGLFSSLGSGLVVVGRSGGSWEVWSGGKGLFR
eukprot:1155620-Pelagomonas_calceolata.AAC.16